ncbi:MAG: hypothetical protein JEY79_19380 [Pseudodesulfovibrio sp.]|nr:hypothetical protein [Pseudodesulfovibrio sp.]
MKIIQNCCYEGHEYSPRICHACGQEYCFECCAGTNVHVGGKHEPDWMECPACGWDYYREIPVDPRKLRRRVEDALRKADPARVAEIAVHMGVKLD